MPEEVPNPRKVRFGLAILALVIIAALIAAVLIDSAVGKAVMVAIAFTVLVRAYLIVRWIRQGGASGVAEA
jgi:hypothetical protein